MVMLKNPRSFKRVVKSSRPLKQDSKSNEKSSGGLFGKGLVVLVCLMIISYLVVDLVCGFKLGQFLPDVLTTSWFAFWAIELVNLVVVKRSKLRAQFPDLIETIPEAMNNLNVNLRSKDDFGNYNEAVQNAVNSGNSELDNPLPVEDFDPSGEYYSYTETTQYTEPENQSIDKGGKSECLNLIY